MYGYPECVVCGSEAGDAIADVVFGDVSPSGKLTTSFPRAVGQLPLYYNHLSTGRRIRMIPLLTVMAAITSTRAMNRYILLAMV